MCVRPMSTNGYSNIYANYYLVSRSNSKLEEVPKTAHIVVPVLLIPGPAVINGL